jgi:hypothetical protein
MEANCHSGSRPSHCQSDLSQNRRSRALFALRAMQATEEWHIVHRCEQCGMVIMIARPPGATEKENPTTFYRGDRHDNAK